MANEEVHETETQLPAEIFPRGPVPFLQVSDGRWHVNKDAIDILKKINMDIVPVAIVGKYRTGKSSLMNRIAGAKSGFGVGSTIQSMTKGIWMWPTVHPWSKGRCLLLLDTEGLYDVEKGDPDNDLQMFALALLMSTCIIFNIMYNLDDQFVKELQNMYALCNTLSSFQNRVIQDTPWFITWLKLVQNPERILDKYMQSLVKQQLKLPFSIQFAEINSDEYLELAIASKPEKGEHYNKPRDSIKRLFQQRNCFVLPRPVKDDKLLRRLDGGDDIPFIPEFLDKSKEASDKILEQASSFTCYGRLGTAEEYIDILQEYVKCINDGGIPSIGSAFASLRERQLTKVAEDLISHYQERKTILQSCFPVSLKDLPILRSDIQKLVKEKLTKMRLPQEIYDRSLGSCESKLDKLHLKTLEENEEALMKICKEAFGYCFSNILGPCNEYIKRGGYEEYLEAKGKSIDAYFSEVEQHGTPAKSKLTHFLETLVDKENGLRCSCEKVEEIEREKERDAKLLLEKQQQLQEELSKFKKEAEVQSEASKEEYASMQKGYENMLQEKDQAHEKERDEYKTLLDNVRKEQEQLKADLTNRMKARIEIIKKDTEEVQRSVDKLDSKLARLKGVKNKDPLSAEYSRVLAEAND